ncbi:site-specific DNA-methyltransferase [Brevundimonas mediterranea]|uniref:site-specific DNA-methyltransferase (adenine-specific) n=1 Tax=Brevundimonas mediterranea TaxID=74329 RepID=A0AB37EAU2_9CAUL|nr:site-specific DNA-methyltransferase [Brevundimonas mediterranea]
MTPVSADEPEASSADPVAANIEALKALFPDAISEGGVDFDTLRQMLGDAVDDDEEKYGLTWSGKRQTRRLALTPSLGTLLPAPGDSVDWETTQNLMIEGDNLEVLKLLQKSYAGKVKLIYIDPPYNTGSDFVYPDDYSDSLGNYLRQTRQIDANGVRYTSNPEGSGRYHTEWLNMMYPRLLMCRSLLAQDGAIFISVDDHEVSNLRLVADSVFGQENFVCVIAVVNNLKGRNDRRHIATAHESMLFYARPEFISYGLPLTPEQKAAFKLVDELGRPYALRDLRKRGGPDRREDRPNMYFPIYWDPNTGDCSLVREGRYTDTALPLRGDGSDGRWRWGVETVSRHLSWLHARRSKKTGKVDVEHRVYLDASISVGEGKDADDDEDEGGFERSAKPKSIWLGGSLSSDTAKRVVKDLGFGDAFDTPKALDHIQNIVTLASRDNAIILDFFAGSGTTGHAVMSQNAADGGNRRYILVQLPEPLDPENKDQKAAADFCDSIGKPRNIAELTKERLRRAASKVKADNADTTADLGFRAYKLATSNLKTWAPGDNLEADLLSAADNLAPGRTEDDLLVELLLKRGIDLTEPSQTRQIAGQTVHAFGGGVMLACLGDVKVADAEALADGIGDWVETLSPITPVMIFFKDAGFENDVAKTNVAKILDQRLNDRGPGEAHLLEAVRSV